MHQTLASVVLTICRLEEFEKPIKTVTTGLKLQKNVFFAIGIKNQEI